MTGCGFCAHVWTVEDIFRTTKSILETRPIYHKCDDTIRGHVWPLPGRFRIHPPVELSGIVEPYARTDIADKSGVRASMQ
jgi:hypothetical protein